MAEPAITMTYDLNGNLLTDDLTSYEWDADSRLVAATSSPWGRVGLKYDAFSRRVRIIEKAPSTLGVEADKQLVWDGLDIVQQYEVIGNQIRRYYGNGETREQPGAAPYEYFYTRDHLGNIREVVAKYNGTVLARYDYTPYGIRTKLSGTVDCDFGFTGHYTNERSGLVLAPYRAYEPKLGRWISRDPIEEDGGINLYGYVSSNPIALLDMLGLCPKCATDASKAVAEMTLPMLEAIKSGEIAVCTVLKEAARLRLHFLTKTLPHIFDKSKHGLEFLVQKSGSQEAAYNVINNALKAAPLSQTSNNVHLIIEGVKCIVNMLSGTEFPSLVTHGYCFSFSQFHGHRSTCCKISALWTH